MPAKKKSAVPSSRAGRLARVVRLAGGVAGGMLAEGSRRLGRGERPRARDMLLTPGNAKRLREELAHLRGAAMKIGQILSMDAGDVLPRELTDILSSLRADGIEMPTVQLWQAMEDAYGDDWETQFYGFEAHPIAAASIGQVHRAFGPAGAEIALKVQFPGVAASIDSDVDNIAGLLRISGLLPDGFDLKPLLREAKKQLQEEADYQAEAEHLRSYGEWLADDARFLVPQVYPELSRPTVLVMEHVYSEPIESIIDLPETQRNELVSALFELMFSEFFQRRVVQTDPNFANYRYRTDDGRLVLLDFGATRHFSKKFVDGYRRLLKAALRGDDQGVLAAAERLGYVVAGAEEEYRDLVQTVFALALEPILAAQPYDFGRSDLSARLNKLAEGFWDYRGAWQAPPPDAIFFHRKVGGMFMLAARLRATVPVHELLLKVL